MTLSGATVDGMYGPLRRAARRWYRALPRQRRVRGLVGFGNVRLLQIRNLVPGLRRFPVVVTRSSDSLKFRLTADPLDEEIADSVTRKHRDLYFPRMPSDTSVATIVDIGAHHGHFSIAAAFEYPLANIIAVEPAAAAVQNIRRQVELNGLEDRIRIVSSALGARSGHARLLHDATGSWGHSLVAVKDGNSSEQVSTITFEEILAGRHADFIKCNAEGGEADLIHSLEAIASLPATIVLMAHPELVDSDDLRARVLRLGYTVSDAVDGAHPVWICTLDPS